MTSLTYVSLRSIPTAFRPKSLATAMLVPLPRNGSSMEPPSGEPVSTHRRTSSAGNAALMVDSFHSLDRDIPHVLFNQLRAVIRIEPRLAEKEDMLILPVRAIACGRFCECVAAVPDNVTTERPATLLHRQGDFPRHAEQALFGNVPARTIHRPYLLSHEITRRTARVRTVRLSVAGVVGIPDIQVEHAFGMKHALHLVEYVGKCRDEPLDRFLVPELTVIAVVPSPIVRRASDRGN